MTPRTRSSHPRPSRRQPALALLPVPLPMPMPLLAGSRLTALLAALLPALLIGALLPSSLRAQQPSGRTPAQSPPATDPQAPPPAQPPPGEAGEAAPAPERADAVVTPSDAAKPPRERDWLSPFRNPSLAIDTTGGLFEDLRRMHAIAQQAPREKLRLDDEGREICDDPSWKAGLANVIQNRNFAPMLSQVLRESAVAADRRLAAWASYYVPSVDDALLLVSHLPGEPLREIRSAFYPRAVAFVRAQLGKKGDHGRYRFGMNLQPFAELVELDDPRDQAQGLWFLKECVAVRPELARAVFETLLPVLPARLASRDVAVRREAHALVVQADPQHRPAPDAASDAEMREWLRTVTEEVIPPVDVVSEGLVVLRSGRLLDEIARVGTDALRRQAIGTAATVRASSGSTPYRGFKVQRLPEPLDRLGLPLDAVITHVNGLPTGDEQQLLQTVTEAVAARRNLVVDFVHGGKAKAIEYRWAK